MLATKILKLENKKIMFKTNQQTIHAELKLMNYTDAQLNQLSSIIEVLEPHVEAALIERRNNSSNNPADLGCQLINQFASSCLAMPHKDIASAIMATAIASLITASGNPAAKASISSRGGIALNELDSKLAKLAIDCGIAAELHKFVTDIQMKNPVRGPMLEELANTCKVKYGMLVSLFKAIPREALTSDHCNLIGIKPIARDTNEHNTSTALHDNAMRTAIMDAETRTGTRVRTVTVKKRGWSPNRANRHPVVCAAGMQVVFELEDGIIKQLFVPIEKEEDGMEVRNHGIDLEAAAERELNEQERIARQIKAEREAAASAAQASTVAEPVPVATHTYEMATLEGGCVCSENDLQLLASEAVSNNTGNGFEADVQVTAIVPPGHATESQKISVIVESGLRIHSLSPAAPKSDHGQFAAIMETVAGCTKISELYEIGARINRLSARPILQAAAMAYTKLVEDACIRYMRHQLSDNWLTSFDFLTDSYESLKNLERGMFQDEWLATLHLLEEALPRIISSVGDCIKFPEGLEHSSIFIAQPVINAGVGCSFRSLDFEYPEGFGCGARLQPRHTGAAALFTELLNKLTDSRALYVRVMGVDGKEYAIAVSPVANAPLVYAP